MNLPIDQIICHDVAKGIPLPDGCIDVVITSPPYWSLRDYQIEGQIGLEKHPQEYINKIVGICQEIKRVLKKSGSFYLNLGDSYYGSGGAGEDYNEGGLREGQPLYKQSKTTKSNWLQAKQLMLVPSRVAIALQNDGWILRNDVCWNKVNHMPSSVKDRLANSWEHVFFFVKSKKYFYDLDAIRSPHKIESLKRDNYGYPISPMRGRYQIPWEKRHGTSDQSFCNPKGKNPGDTVKHDIAIGRIGNFSYDDPLHTKEYHPDGKNPSDFWSLTTQPFTGYSEELEHFAVFPEELVVRPLLASCPQFVCKKCGKPRERITKGTSSEAFNIRVRDVKENRIKHTDRVASEKEVEKYQEGVTHAGTGKVTIGFTDCGCKAGFVPGVVLDPFCGRGTVGRVAKRLGLRYIMVDIKPEYCELARLYIAGQKHKIQKGQKKLRTS